MLNTPLGGDILSLDPLPDCRPEPQWFTDDLALADPITSPLHIPNEGLPSPRESLDFMLDWPAGTVPLDTYAPPPNIASISLPLILTKPEPKRSRSTEDLEKSGVSTHYTDGKRRHTMPTKAVEEITTWIRTNPLCPYPTLEQKLDWCRRYDMPMCQLNTFLVNRRMRILGPRGSRSMFPLRMQQFLVLAGRSLQSRGH